MYCSLMMVARETHLCCWIRLCCPCFILSHIRNFSKSEGLVESWTMGECAAYGGSKCWDISSVCFSNMGHGETAQGLSTELENGSISLVWALLSQMWGCVLSWHTQQNFCPFLEFSKDWTFQQLRGVGLLHDCVTFHSHAFFPAKD